MKFKRGQKVYILKRSEVHNDTLALVEGLVFLRQKINGNIRYGIKLHDDTTTHLRLEKDVYASPTEILLERP